MGLFDKSDAGELIFALQVISTPQVTPMAARIAPRDRLGCGHTKIAAGLVKKALQF
jgi:hypothetical protein